MPELRRRETWFVGADNKGTKLARRTGNGLVSLNVGTPAHFVFFLLTGARNALLGLLGTQFLTHIGSFFSYRAGGDLVWTLLSLWPPSCPRSALPDPGSSGGWRSDQRSPTLAHYARCSMALPLSHGCWHQGHEHLFTTCKSQRRW